MKSVTISGMLFKADVVDTADGKVERLTTTVSGSLVQVNRHQNNDNFCTVMINGVMSGAMKLDDVGFYIQTKLGG